MTTILCIRKGDEVVVAGDGQVSMGDTVVKSNAMKLRRLHNGSVITGFAGATADADRRDLEILRSREAHQTVDFVEKYYFIFQDFQYLKYSLSPSLDTLTSCN